ncbi:unnamed protein product [Phyllotreta striolata]|uniref:C-type lectin domain-containing protein n=1 Tax=Phyllotreta striolata TaxID=444603 RepID=A0A9N9XM90_PHYSR|nr:unnamed protein product [Phyllotreta striolata]
MLRYKSVTFCAIFAQILVILDLFSVCYGNSGSLSQEYWKNLSGQKSPALPLVHNGVKSYYIGNIFKAEFLQAQQFCKFHGMELLSIESKEENDFLNKKIVDAGNRNERLWTSGTRVPETDHWMWLSTGKSISYFNWNIHQPDNDKQNEKCMEIVQESPAGIRYGDFKMNDVPCHYKFFFICEFKWTKNCTKFLESVHVDQDKLKEINDLIDVR